MKHRQAIYWILQITVWSFYFFYNVNITFDVFLSKFKEVVFLYSFLYAYFGIPLTVVLRLVFVWLKKQSISNWMFVISVFAVVFIAANIWTIEVYFLDRIFESDELKMSPLNLKFYIWEVFRDFLVLLAWSAFYLLTKLWYEWQTEKQRAEKAMYLAQRSQLQMLRNQINPHFLFNTLSSLRALVRDNQKKAEEMISKISEFLRYSLISKKETEVPLIEEIEAVKNYIEIEKVRYDENLDVNFQIDPQAEDYPIPSFLVHPIVENAVKYGIDTSPMPLVIEVKALIRKGNLIIEIKNSGTWIDNLQEEKTVGTGTGLQNVQDRLEQLYPKKHKFNIEKLNGNVTVRIELESNLNQNEK